MNNCQLVSGLSIFVNSIADVVNDASKSPKRRLDVAAVNSYDIDDRVDTVYTTSCIETTIVWGILRRAENPGLFSYV